MAPAVELPSHGRCGRGSSSGTTAPRRWRRRRCGASTTRCSTPRASATARPRRPTSPSASTSRPPSRGRAAGRPPPARSRQRRPDAIPYSYEFDEPIDQAREARRRGGVGPQGRERAGRAAARDRTAVGRPPAGQVGTFAVHLKDAATAPPEVQALGAELWIYTSCSERRGDPTMLMTSRRRTPRSRPPPSSPAARAPLPGRVRLHATRGASRDRPTGVANGDGVLIYPGRPAGLSGPVPSLRLKLFALGMQLVDLADVAEARGAGDGGAGRADDARLAGARSSR